jgi:phosphatidylserine/phosphatidylglycerophosphate/cardiolipin synthase-like enzyme
MLEGLFVRHRQGFGRRGAWLHGWERRLTAMLCLIGIAALEILAHQREAVPLGNGSVEIRYAPATDLERIDLALLRQATRSIDMAAYLVTDIAVIEALASAAERGVRVRLYLDGEQEVSGPGFAGRAQGLRGAQRIEVKLKPPRSEIMHLKSYCVDGKVLRTGSANFTVWGLRREDDDLIVIREPQTIAAFEASFETIWRRSGNIAVSVGGAKP